MLTLAPEGEPAEGMGWVWLLSAVLSLAVMILGPLAAWRLHGRPLTWIAVLGAIVGGFVGANIVGMLAMLVLAPVGWLVSTVTNSEFAGPIAILVLVSAAFVALLVRLVADGCATFHRRGGFTHGWISSASCARRCSWCSPSGSRSGRLGTPGDQSGEAIIFAMVFGMSAAMIVTGAAIATTLAAERKRAPSGTTS